MRSRRYCYLFVCSQVVLAATELSTLTAVRAFVAPHLNRWLNSPAFKDMARCVHGCMREGGDIVHANDRLMSQDNPHSSSRSACPLEI